MPALTSRDLARMAVRSALLQATWNYERQQGLGWAYAIEPALERFYPDPAERRVRMVEHTAYFNTQPTMASLVVGAVAGLEEQRASGSGPDAGAVTRIKNVLGASLAALGDRLFWFSLRPFAACLGILLALTGSWAGAAGLWVCYNLVHQTVRHLGVGWGYRAGPGVLNDSFRRRFQMLVRVLSILGALLVGVLSAAFLVPGGEPAPLVFQASLAAGLTLGLIAARRSRPSASEYGIALCVMCVVAAWFGG
jgi:mannose/fructose/N-acetylgalactosamine-specific phosphotransferase system component IID